MDIESLICAVQKKLRVRIDGKAGPETWAAIYTAIFGSTALLNDPVDERSEKNIATLDEDVRPYARALVSACVRRGIVVKVTSGTRGCAEQNALFAQGRSKPGKIVTNCQCGESNHQFGRAFDVTLFNAAGKPVYESPVYKAIGAIGRSLGLKWGGDWTSPVDEPHFELWPAWAEGMTERQMKAELKRRFPKGLLP